MSRPKGLHWTIALMGGGLAGALALIIYGEHRPAVRSFQGKFVDLLPTAAEVPGWQASDMPIADTPEMQKKVGEALNYDDAVFRTYTRGADHLAVYVAYWTPGKMSHRLVAGHTPDVCWVGGGWKIEAAESGVVLRPETGRSAAARRGWSDSGASPRSGEVTEAGALWATDGTNLRPERGKAASGGLKTEDAERSAGLGSQLSQQTQVAGSRSQPSVPSGRRSQLSGFRSPSTQVSGLTSQVSALLPAEVRTMSLAGVTEHVAFWHRVGRRFVSYQTVGKPPWSAALADLLSHGLDQREEQFFIRFSSNLPVEAWPALAPFQIAAARLPITAADGGRRGQDQETKGPKDQGT